MQDREKNDTGSSLVKVAGDGGDEADGAVVLWQSCAAGPFRSAIMYWESR
jgi:hypothetical protein